MKTDLHSATTGRCSEIPEIEITPEMIEAGCLKLSLFDPGEDSAEGREQIVAAIYRVMRVADLGR